MDTITNDLERFQSLIHASKRIVFFTGAGVSTESGIPDFRSPGTGIWNKIKPIDFQDFVGSESVRKESWRRKFSGDERYTSAKPNKGHLAIAQLISQGKASSVITQNVDNLHQDSGVPAAQVIELHGNAHYATCLDCGKRYELADLKNQFNATGEVAPCSVCSGVIKTATISFGQAMPWDKVTKAEEEARSCDLLIVVGSSLVVHPAAQLPLVAKQSGAKLVILNRESTPLDEYADLVLNEEIGPTLSWVTGES